MDAFAADQARAARAEKAGHFISQITPVEVKQRRQMVCLKRMNISEKAPPPEVLWRPAFAKDGVVTAGNSSGINDGTASLVLANTERSKPMGCTVGPDSRLWFRRGCASGHGHGAGTGNPDGTKTRWTDRRRSCQRSNEAFAAQACAVSRALNFDAARVNPMVAIALGHPIGAPAPS